MSTLRTPLRRVIGLGSAKGGSGHWYSQRVTAVALVLLGVWFFAGLVRLEDGGYESVTRWLASPLSSALAILLVLTSAWHALLGLQVILEDYVASKGRRAVLLLAVKFAYAVAAVVGVLAVLRIAFGAAA
ncbi:MAG: succinate dehydrogenase, hydrophobic membrane anchor protein [Lysobacterales bacterium]|jgi:succinate dehydrogenase / fumarate reductase membrane anchor subunit|nr:MAG: succinate dehydrogenase, hydrophobic membrane anchor protein [Xanthomonadales bacterium]